LQILDPAIMPLGIITLEDVLEELIGEEIYDEFDPYHDGAQLSSFIPPDSDAGDKVTVSANVPDRNHPDVLLSTTDHGDAHTVGFDLGPGPGVTVVKPIALRAMEGFGMFTNRSKSAPPVQKDQVGKQSPSRFCVSPKTRDTNGSSMLPGNGTNEKTDVSHLDLHAYPPGQIPISGVRSQRLTNQPQTPPLDPTIPHSSTISSYRLDRKRKAVSGGGITPRVATPISVKGKGFKSSPLPTEMDITDGVKNEGSNNAASEGDGGAPPSETAM